MSGFGLSGFGARQGLPKVFIVHFAIGASLAAARARAKVDGGIVVNLADAVAGVASVTIAVPGMLASVYAYNRVKATNNLLDWLGKLGGVGVAEPQLDTYSAATQAAVASMSDDAPVAIDTLVVSYFVNAAPSDAWSETHAIIIPNP